MIAGHPTSDQVEDHVAVESDRRTAGTFLWLIVLSLPIAGGLAVLRDRRPPRLAAGGRRPRAGSETPAEAGSQPRAAAPTRLADAGATGGAAPAPDTRGRRASGARRRGAGRVENRLTS